MKYKAQRSFYGTLGSIRRGQIVETDDKRTADELIKKGLLVAEGEAPKGDADPDQKPKGRKAT